MYNTENIVLWGPFYLIIAALIWGFARIIFLANQENVSVLAVLSRRKTPVEKLAGIIAVILDVYLLIRPFSPNIDSQAYGFTHPFSVFGVMIMAVGIGLAILSQIDMGKSWRIGIPENKEDSQSLITSGLYNYSRNPIYVGIVLFLIGAAIAIPGPITIIALLGSTILIGKIIEQEEDFMQQSFGDEYHCYCQKVRRWL